jgi:hypothetical protein
MTEVGGYNLLQVIAEITQAEKFAIKNSKF